MKNYLMGFALFILPVFTVFYDAGTLKQNENVCQYTLLRGDVSQAFWDEVTAGKYDSVCYIKIGSGVQMSANDFTNSDEYQKALNDLCINTSPFFVVIDEIDGI